MSTDDHKLRYSPLAQAVERILSRRLIQKRIDGYTLETSIEVAQAVLDLLSNKNPEPGSYAAMFPEDEDVRYR